ncbi:PAS domain S-box protein [Pseudomonas sp. B21-056]|jgi:PAS domain S-box-containing protein|uniref:PAS domain S-box protein n=1 Tax=Pseudomonas sp. B21-056 TaxID=2895495 RepID=UPI002231BE92|nr:PAS domain S-box protein [Pseudomonas sp. B21-056]UZE26086.1 PAS domain S-box protein [Pseudomonas sp. B21-056]
MMLSMETGVSTPWTAQSQLAQAMFDLVSCALVLLDDQGRILKANNVFAELLGHVPRNLPGIHFQVLIHCAEVNRQQSMDGPGLSAVLTDRCLELRHMDGSLLPVRSRLVAVDEHLLIEIVPLEDPQSLGRSMQQNQWLQRIVETAPGIIGIFRLGPKGDISMPWASPGYEEYYGLTADELMRDATILFERIHPEDVARVQESIVQSGRTLSPWQCEYRVRHPIKGEIWLEGRSKPSLETDGSIIWFGFLHDISERKRTELALRKSEERLSLLDFTLSHMREAAYLFDHQGRVCYVNDEACRSLGFARDVLLGMTIADIDPDVTNEQILEGWDPNPEHPPEIFESRNRTRDGRIFPVEVSITYLEFDGQNYCLGLARDISERKRMETKLLTSEQQFRALAENSQNLIIRYDLNCQRIYVNPAFERETDIPATRALQVPLEESWTASMSVAQYRALLCQVIATGTCVETVLEWPGKDGAAIVVHAVQMIAERGVDGAVVSVLVEGYNITALKHHERLLLESEQRYRQIFDSSPDCMFLLEVAAKDSFRIIEVNPVLERRLDRERAELLGKTIEQSLSPSVAAESIARYRRCVDGGIAIDEEVEYELSTGPGVFHLTLIPIRTAFGSVQRIVGICRDITERKHAERVLHAREQEFRALVENTPDVIARFNPQCCFLYANPAAQSLLGRSQAYLLGKTSSEVSPLSQAARSFQRKLEDILRTGEASEAEFILDTPVAQGAEAACYQARLVPECDQSGRLVSILAVGRDVSAERAAERRLKDSHAQLRLLSSHRETTREEERKHIAREIHDELGQQLSALRMGISLLRLQFGAEQPLLVDRVQVLMTRVDEIIQVVRNVATSLRPSALNMGLTSALEWLVSEFSQNTGIDCRLSAPSARLLLDDERATAIFRVIQESLTNVCRHAQASRVEIHLEQDAEHLQIEVRDNGKGFDPAQLPKGTLGMLGMRERGHMVGGTVTIDSTPGQGARVRVNIPFQVGPALL